MSNNKALKDLLRFTITSIHQQRIATLLITIGIGIISNCFFSNAAIAKLAIGIAQTTSQTESQSTLNVANVNEVKGFIYSWFALLDRQVSEISLLKFLDKDNLSMKFPEMTVNNPDDFSEWYLGVQKAIKSNTHDIQQLSVTPQKNGEFDIQIKVNWQAQTLEGESITQAYQQQWKIVTDARNRLLIREYLVEEVK